MPADVQLAMQQKLEEHLYGAGGFQKGSELSIRYRFLQVTERGLFRRWLGGEDSLTVEAKFLDRSDNILAVIQVEGLAGQGPLAADLDRAIEKVAERVAEYAQTNYR
ncbi:MAG TPA: hypothetical protein VNL14_09860 [Candidatus Acidoferrales bacterium]|nr:hypothetical protein [Candidatus Acidoferrales bacterium]